MTTKPYFLSLFLFAFASFSAISANLDSLAASLKTEKNIETKITALNDLCFGFVYSDPKKSAEYGNRALRLSRKYNKTKLEGKALNRLGIMYDVISEWDNALVYYNQALDIATEINDTSNLASTHTNIGLIRWHQREYDKAIGHFLEGIKGFKLLGKDAGVASCYNNISLIYIDQERYGKAKSYLFKALKIRRKQDNNYALADVLINLSTAYSQDLKTADSAKMFVDEAVIILKEENDHYGLGTAYNTISALHSKAGDHDSTIYYGLKSYEEHKIIGNKRDMLGSIYNVAIHSGERGNQKERHKYLLEAQELAEEVGDLKIKKEIYNSLAMSYVIRGEYDKASRAYEIKGIISDSLQKIEREEMADRLEVEFRTAEKDQELAEQELELLRSNEQKAKDDLIISNRNKWIFSLLAGLLGLLFFGLFIVTRNKRKAESEKGAALLAEKELKINEIIEARELERERISRDLHDGICQTLTALRMQQCDIKDEIAKKDQEMAQLLQKSIDTTSIVYNEARELSHQLLPAILEKIGLVQSLRQLLEFSLHSSRINYEYNSSISEEAQYPNEIEIAIYRICQELITNCLKHSNAQNIAIQLYERDNNLILIVNDDGIGLQQGDKDKKGAGLINIEQRTQALKGSFHAETELGLTVTTRIPIS